MAATVRGLLDRHGEKVRFLVVGVCNTAVGYAIFVALLATLGPVVESLSGSPVPWLAAMGRSHYLVVQWAGWFLAVPISTVSMKYLAFRSKGRLLPQIGRAYFIYLPAQGLASVMLWLMVHLIHLHPAVGQLVTIGVTTVFSYLGHKYFTFRTPLEVGEIAPRDLLEREGSGG